MSVSMESCEGEVALEVEGESSSDSELPLTFIHSITVVPVAVLEPDRDLWERKKTQKERMNLHQEKSDFRRQNQIIGLEYRFRARNKMFSFIAYL